MMVVGPWRSVSDGKLMLRSGLAGRHAESKRAHMVDAPARWWTRRPWAALVLSAAQQLAAVNAVRATLVTFLLAAGAVGTLVLPPGRSC